MRGSFSQLFIVGIGSEMRVSFKISFYLAGIYCSIKFT